MAGSEPLIPETDPHIMNLASGARMSDKMVQKTKKKLYFFKILLLHATFGIKTFCNFRCLHNTFTDRPFTYPLLKLKDSFDSADRLGTEQSK